LQIGKDKNEEIPEIFLNKTKWEYSH